MIKSITIPTTSYLNDEDFDYYDSFQGEYQDKNKQVTIFELTQAFFTASPKWVDKLFQLRNSIVSLVGLKTSSNSLKKSRIPSSFEVNDRVGFFRILKKTEHEIIFGEDDTHLNFKVSLFQKPSTNVIQKFTCTTIVKYHNWFGKLYFFFVKPFHKLIVPTIMQQMIKKVENR